MQNLRVEVEQLLAWAKDNDVQTYESDKVTQETTADQTVALPNPSTYRSQMFDIFKTKGEEGLANFVKSKI